MVKIPRVHHKTKTKNEELVAFQSGKVMRDFSKNGKEQPWQKRKIENVKYADYLEILEFKKAHKVKECAEVLEFKIDDNGEKRLYRVWFCKSRLCPLCSWRRAKKAAVKVRYDDGQGHFSALTFNGFAVELDESLMYEGIDKMMKLTCQTR